MRIILFLNKLQTFTNMDEDNWHITYKHQVSGVCEVCLLNIKLKGWETLFYQMILIILVTMTDWLMEMVIVLFSQNSEVKTVKRLNWRLLLRSKYKIGRYVILLWTKGSWCQTSILQLAHLGAKVATHQHSKIKK